MKCYYLFSSGFQHISSQECVNSQPPPMSYQPFGNKETNLDSTLSKQCLNLQKTHQYKFLNISGTDTIVDNIKPVPVHDCPKTRNQNLEISVPSLINKLPTLPIGDPGTSHTQMESPGTSSLEKLADTDRMRVRRRKMKKHQQRRRKAKLWPILRKQKFQKELRKKALFQKELDRIKSYGTNFDAMQEVKSNLEKARKMGYMFDIFGEKSKTFGFLKNKQKVK